MKTMKRALRRHHLRRREKVELKKWKRCSWSDEHAKHTAKITRNTRTLCSCEGCGNPRRHLGERTLQERKFYGV